HCRCMVPPEDRHEQSRSRNPRRPARASAWPSRAFAQPTAALPPPPDRQLRVVDMGKYNLGVGIIHRGPTNDKPGDPIPMIYQDYTPEVYIITSGSGVLPSGYVYPLLLN